MSIQNSVPLPQSARTQRPRARSIGRAPLDDFVDITVRLRRREGRALPYPIPTKHLERGRFAELYGAAESDIDAVTEFLMSAGFRIGEASIPRRSIVARGTLAQAQEAFEVDLSLYEDADGKFIARVGSLQIPKTLAHTIDGVFGLDSRRQARAHFVRRQEHSAAVRADCEASSYTPRQVASAYDFPMSLTGEGECVAIVEFGGGFIEQDLEVYFSRLGLRTPKVVAVSVDGVGNKPTPPDPVTRDRPDSEVMPDMEIIGAICPSATIAVYFAPSTERGWIDVISSIVHDTHHNPSIVSIGWGWAEGTDLWTQQALRILNDSFHEAALFDMTIFVASADDGSADDIHDGKAHVDFPASSPYVVACGGTTFVPRIGIPPLERVWNNGRREGSGGASGGGVSDSFEIPSWQALENVPRSISTSRSGRGIPDVAANADPNTGYLIRVRGDPTGNIGGFHARLGWDACTGLGTPKVQAFLAGLAQTEPSSVLENNTSKCSHTHEWREMHGRAYDIATGPDGTTWIISPDSSGSDLAVHRWSESGWQQVSGDFEKDDRPTLDSDQHPYPVLPPIAIGPTENPIIIDFDGSLFGLSSGKWERIQGTASDISIGDDGSLWVINNSRRSSKIWSNLLLHSPTGWLEVPISPVASVAARNRTLAYCALVEQGLIFAMSPAGIVALRGRCSHICVGLDHSLWAIALPISGTDASRFGGEVCYFSAILNAWVSTGCIAARVAVDSAGRPWVRSGAGLAGKIYCLR